MKKTLSKLLCLLLAAIMLTSVLAACSADEEVGEGKKHNDVVGTEEDPKLPAVDYGDYAFTFITEEGAAYNTGYLIYDGEEANVLDDAIYTRNSIIEDKYNITINQFKVPDIITTVRTQVMGGACEFDVILASCSDLAVMAQENLLKNLLEIETFNWDKSYWDSNSKEQLMIGNKLFFTNCALNIHTIGFCVFFNKQLIEDYQLTSPYEYMANNQWTIDNWSKLVTSISRDVNQDGNMTEVDMYGTLMEHHNPRMFLYASGFRATTNDETGYPQVTLLKDGDKVVNLYEKLKQVFTNEECSYCMTCSDVQFDSALYPHKYSYLRQLFTQDLYLFHYTSEGAMASFAEMESEFGVVPFPKYDEFQDGYKTIYPYNNNLLAIPNVSENLERTAIILEDMNYVSSFTVVPAWFDTLLTRRYARDNESEESLHILRNNCVYDIGLYYNFGDLRSGVLDVDPRQSNISRNYARLERAIKAHIKSIYADFDEFK